MSYFVPSASAADANAHPARDAPPDARRGGATGKCDPNNATFSKKKVFLILGVVAVVSLALALLPSRHFLGRAIDWVGQWGPWALLVFVLVYALLSSVAFPTAPLNVAAGLLFGLMWGFASSLAAVTLAAVVTFFIARYLA